MAEYADAQLTSDVLHGFVGSMLARGFDNPQPTPEFHKEMWDMCCSGNPRVAIAAPRGMGKSSAISHAYVLAELLFRESRFCLLLSSTESFASQFLNDIKIELSENQDLIDLFGVEKIEKDAETDLIVEMEDGHKFRVIAKGAEQKVRGLKWRGKRPDLIVMDDVESDEQVLNKDRREKFRDWFFSAVLPCLSDLGKIRVVGTVLHMDSLLERLLNNEDWVSKRYRAHNEDFSWLLWPEKWPADRLQQKKREYYNEGFPEGYSQEYLNWPIDIHNAMFRRDDFIPMSEEDFDKPKVYYIAADLAISEKERADWTVFLIGGVDPQGYLHIVDRIKGRYDSYEIIEHLFNLQIRYDPAALFFETEKIDKALGPFIERESMERGIYPNIVRKTPTKDKIQRAQSIAARMRQGGVKFNIEADWFLEFQEDLMRVTRSGVRSKHDDNLDAFSWLGLGIQELHASPTREEMIEEEIMEEERDSLPLGMSRVAGY